MYALAQREEKGISKIPTEKIGFFSQIGSIDRSRRFGTEFKALNILSQSKGLVFVCEKRRLGPEVCPKCATPISVRYGKVWVTIHDAPLRNENITLKLLKHRHLCKACRKPFTEPLPGVFPRRRTTQRLRRAISKTTLRQTLIDGGADLRPSNRSRPDNPKRTPRAHIGVAPYGYCIIHGKLVEVPKEQQTVQLILRLRSKGKNLTAIAAHLNSHKVKPRTAKSWDHSIVRSIIKRHQATEKGDHHA